MFDKFKSRAEAVSAEVHRFSTKDEALMFIIDVLKKEGVSDSPRAYAVWADCPFLKGIDRALLSGKVPGLTFEVTRETAAMSHVGISQMDWAIANTGTLAQDSTPVEQRLVSSLSFIHIALVATDGLLADMPSLLTKINPTRERLYSNDNGAEQDSGYRACAHYRRSRTAEAYHRLRR